MRTRIQLILSGILLLGLLSCSKDNDNDKVKTKLDLLTQKTWVYDEFFTDYDESPTVVAYKRGKTNNSLNLSQVSVKFTATALIQKLYKRAEHCPERGNFLTMKPKQR